MSMSSQVLSISSDGDSTTLWASYASVQPPSQSEYEISMIDLVMQY